jgi:hypothetical protein
MVLLSYSIFPSAHSPPPRQRHQYSHSAQELQSVSECHFLMIQVKMRVTLFHVLPAPIGEFVRSEILQAHETSIDLATGGVAPGAAPPHQQRLASFVVPPPNVSLLSQPALCLHRELPCYAPLLTAHILEIITPFFFSSLLINYPEVWLSVMASSVEPAQAVSNHNVLKIENMRSDDPIVRHFGY